MRLFIDTNIWIASIAGGGICHELVEHCRVHHTILTSRFILNEISEILQSKLRFLEISAQFATALIHNNAELVREVSGVSVCRDSDDDHVLAAAKGGNAEAIITGDKDLLVLKNFEKIPILAPTEFWKFEAARSG